MIGQTVSHYKILEKLGEGGMGVVYKAQDTKLDRTVALKFLPARLSGSEQDRARFTQEAKAASALNHPNVCTIHDIQEYEGQMFIVMEFVDGHTLREKISALSLKQAMDIGVQVADGLAAAHEKGIVHRDIKPENIMLRKDGIAQIMDFGLAKLRGNVTRLTREGSTIGTAGYMSPEQVQGQDTDHRSDIFSFGVMLYEMIAGAPPFKGVHETALLYEIVNVDPAPISAVKPEIDPGIDAIVLECLEKDPNERTQSVKQVSIDLKRFKRESTRQRVTRTIATRQFDRPAVQPLPQESAPPKSIRKLLLPLLSGLLALAVGLLAWLIFSPIQNDAPANRPVTHLTLDLPANELHVGGNDGVQVSHDGRYLVYTAGAVNNTQLGLRRMDQMTPTLIPGTEGGDEPCFSPDGQSIAFSLGDKIEKVSIFGGAPEVLCSSQGITRGLWWASDNFIYFGLISRGLYRVPSKGGSPEALTTPDSSTGELSHRYPQILPDGKTILFTIKPNNITSFDDALIAVQRLGTNDKKILIHGGTYARYVPGGYIVFVRGNSIYATQFDPEHLEVKGLPLPISEGGWMNPGSGSAELSFSDNGAFVSAPGGSISFNFTYISWMDLQGKITPLLDTLRFYQIATLSPDGQKLALNLNAANDDIWIYQIARGTLTRLTFGGGNNDYPIWSPDGKYVVYQAEKGKSPNIFRKAWDGSGTEERLTTSDKAQLATSISPDGKLLAFNQDGDIWILPLAGDRKAWPIVQSPAAEYNGTFSPDGQWLAYHSNESGKFEVYVVPFPKHDGKWQISTGGGGGPLWSGNGKELFYTNGTSVMAVDVMAGTSFDNSAPRKLFELPASSTGLFDVARDGQHFVVGQAKTQQLPINQLNITLEWFSELKEKFASGRN